ncbi:MAG: hypothetical protein Hyperionvirus11_36 [Hyperionvirus sp.]|uniref:Uncharacterized protein n=1 Tax=Hyperionvirus sp. TaxID=2487770 RepID=A0A3G5ACZ9_9VIRU|nr:MAG: hypothetical protein Hyperionvirus11_36 [Hyperionvirus sp.]
MATACLFTRPIEIFPTRLKPILYLSLDSIIIVDFVNGVLFSSCEMRRLRTRWDFMQIQRENNKITIYLQTHERIVTHCLKIDLGIPEIALVDGVVSDGVAGITYSNVLDDSFGNASGCWGSTASIFDIPHLLKLHPRTHDPDGLYKDYFCWFGAGILRIGSIHDNVKLTHPFFSSIAGFSLTEDNILMLFIKIKEDYILSNTRLMFVDCNEVKVLGECSLPNNFTMVPEESHIFAELQPTRNDFLVVKDRVIRLLFDYILPPLADIVLGYLVGNIPAEIQKKLS